MTIAPRFYRVSTAIYPFLLLMLSVGCFFVTGPGLKFVDEFQYYTIAVNILEKNVFALNGDTPTAERPPGYPFFLAFWVLLSKNILWLKAINLALWVASGVLVFRIARKLYGESAALAAGAMYLLYGASLYTAGTLYPQTLGGFLLLAMVYLVVRQDGDISRAVIPVFCLIAAASQVVILFIVLAPLFLVFFVAEQRETWRRCLLGLAIVILSWGPWTVRNYDVFGTFIPFGTNGGLVLLHGNSENATATSGVTSDISRYKNESRGLGEVARNRYLQRAAITWIVEHPRQAAVLYVQKFMNWFNYRSELATQVSGQNRKALLLAASYYPILVLAIGYFVVRRREADARSWLLLVIYLAMAAAYAVFFTRIRFRLPFDSLLMILAAGLIGKYVSVAGSGIPNAAIRNELLRK